VPPGPADDGEFVPPVPPPLPSLDPVAKGAWVALFGGPGYLLLATMVGWAIRLGRISGRGRVRRRLRDPGGQDG
jgi:hypothetical protein